MSNPIDELSSAAGSTSSSASSFTQARQDALNAVANELGISATDLRSSLSSGETLTQLAASKGVSSTALQSTIETALKADLPNASDSQISGLASRIASGHHGHHGHGHSAEVSGSSGSSSSGAAATDATGDGNAVGSLYNVVA